MTFGRGKGTVDKEGKVRGVFGEIHRGKVELVELRGWAGAGEEVLGDGNGDRR